MANELKTTKLVLIGGEPMRLPIRGSDPGSGAEGELYYNSTSKTVRLYDGSAWEDLSAASDPGKADTDLGNLAATAVNADIIPATDNTVDLGSAANAWAEVHAEDVIATELSVDSITSAETSITFNSKVLKDLAAPAADQDAATKKYVDDSVAAAAPSAADVSYDNEVSELAAENVQAAIDELAASHDSLSESVTAISEDLADVIELTGVASGSTDLGSFTGTTIPDASDIKEALQALETADELKIPLSQKAANNGVATLDAGGKIPLTQLPAAVMTYEGVWDADTNAPTLADGTGDAGMVYLVNVAGTQDLGSGDISFNIGDWVVYSGTVWQKSTNSNEVVSVNGQTGVVSLDTDDVPQGDANLYYTAAQARTDIIASTITDADTTHAPSADAVFDALALKADASAIADFVEGPDGATDNALARFDLDTGKLIKDSSVTLSDDGELLGVSKAVIGDLTLEEDTISAPDSVTIASDQVNLSSGIVARGTSPTSLIEERYFHNIMLMNNQIIPTNIAGLSFPIADYQGVEMTFKVTETDGFTPNNVRIGTIRVAAFGTTISVVPVYTETGIIGNPSDSVGLKISAIIDSGNIVFQYVDTAGLAVCVLRADVKLFRA